MHQNEIHIVTCMKINIFLQDDDDDIKAFVINFNGIIYLYCSFSFIHMYLLINYPNINKLNRIFVICRRMLSTTWPVRLLTPSLSWTTTACRSPVLLKAGSTREPSEDSPSSSEKVARLTDAVPSLTGMENYLYLLYYIIDNIRAMNVVLK